MKLRDYEMSINVMDAEATTVMERLSKLDPTTDEYRKAAEALKTLQEAKQIEVQNKVNHLSGKVPSWGVSIVSFVTAVLFGRYVVRKEDAGAFISSNAINVWDKVIRKF